MTSFCGGDNDECALEQIDQTIRWIFMGPSVSDIRARLTRLIDLAHEEGRQEAAVVGAAIVAWADAIRSQEFFKQACTMLEIECACAVRHGHFSHCPRSKPWNTTAKWRIRADKTLEYIGK